MSCLTASSELQSALPMKCLPVSGHKLYRPDVCRATNGGHI